MGSPRRIFSNSSVKISARTRGGKSACDCGVQRPQGAMKPLRLRSASRFRQPRLLKEFLEQAPSCGLPERRVREGKEARREASLTVSGW